MADVMIIEDFKYDRTPDLRSDSVNPVAIHFYRCVFYTEEPRLPETCKEVWFDRETMTDEVTNEFNQDLFLYTIATNRGWCSKYGIGVDPDFLLVDFAKHRIEVGASSGEEYCALADAVKEVYPDLIIVFCV